MNGSCFPAKTSVICYSFHNKNSKGGCIECYTVWYGRQHQFSEPHLLHPLCEAINIATASVHRPAVAVFRKSFPIQF